MRGVRDLLVGLKVYKPKIKNTLMDYMKEKDTRAKWNLGVSVEMVQMDREGAIIASIQPGFKTSAILQLAMYNFDHTYANAVDKIQDKLIAFNRKECLQNLLCDNVSIHKQQCRWIYYANFGMSMQRSC